MIVSIKTVASALASARECSLPGKETAAINDVLWWCARRSLLLYPRSSSIARPKNVVALPYQPEFRQIEVEVSLSNALRKEAAVRGTNVDRLVRDLLDRIVADQLCNAILDDQSAAD